MEDIWHQARSRTFPGFGGFSVVARCSLVITPRPYTRNPSDASHSGGNSWASTLKGLKSLLRCWAWRGRSGSSGRDCIERFSASNLAEALRRIKGLFKAMVGLEKNMGCFEIRWEQHRRVAGKLIQYCKAK